MPGLRERLRAYSVDVDFAGVSGFEIIDVLMERSETARGETALSEEERQELEAADRALMRRARQFYASLREVADIAELRRRSGALPSQWWWYLDVLAEEPVAAA